jgi:DNA-binding MarR family transcriptional regulator
MNRESNLPFLTVIPFNVMSNKKLEAEEKLHYGCMFVLRNSKGNCIATIKQLAEMQNVSIEQIEKWNKSLEDQGYITLKDKNTILLNNRSVQ